MDGKKVRLLLAVNFIMIMMCALPLFAEKPGAIGGDEDMLQGRSTAEILPKENKGKTGELESGYITVNFKGADIKTVLNYISEVAGVDIVTAPDVTGPVDLKLTNKHWQVALDIIVRNYGYAYEREENVIRIVTVDRLKLEELSTQAFSLSYAKSADVVNAVENILTDRGSVTFDERTNTILVTDIPTNIYKIGDIIRRLDASTPQVLIEARIIETSLNYNEKLGIDWNTAITIAGAKRPWTAPFHQFGTQTYSHLLYQYYPLVQTGQKTSTFDAGGGQTTQDPGPYPAGAQGIGNDSRAFPFVDYTQPLFENEFVFGTLDFSQFKAVMEFIKDRADTDIISNPRITTLDNKEATILVGHVLWMPKYERNKNTGAMEIAGYEQKDLGIKLRVTPHINVRNEIIVEVEPEITELLRYDTVNEKEGVVVPVFSTRKAKTQVLMFNGDTVFIGGLIKEYDKTVKTKLPLLGDIFGNVPFLDLLFTHKEVTKSKTELIFFITVNLVTVGRKIENVPSAAEVYAPQFRLFEKKMSPDRNKKKRRKKKVSRR